jgi:GT2 family glycosyltransferase
MSRNPSGTSFTSIIATLLRAYRYGGLNEVIGCVYDGVLSATKPLVAKACGVRPPKRFWPAYCKIIKSESRYPSSRCETEYKDAFKGCSKTTVDQRSNDDAAEIALSGVRFESESEFVTAPPLYVFCTLTTPHSAGDSTSRMGETSNTKSAQKVSVVIPTRDRPKLLQAAVSAVCEHGGTANIEIIIVDNGSVENKTAAVLESLANNRGALILRDDGDFNWSRLNNLAVRHASGEMLLFLNNDVASTPSSYGWLDRLVAYAALENVGCVGPMLLYPDGTIQHAGVVIGMGRWADHIYKGADPDLDWKDTPFIPPKYPRSVLAVTGACLMVSSKNFKMLGGFDEAFQIVFSDVEFCLRAYKAGLTNLYAGDVRLYHHESKSRDPKVVPDSDFHEARGKLEPYRTEECDPYFHPRLDKFSNYPKSDLLPTNLSRWIRS